MSSDIRRPINKMVCSFKYWKPVISKRSNFLFFLLLLLSLLSFCHLVSAVNVGEERSLSRGRGEGNSKDLNGNVKPRRLTLNKEHIKELGYRKLKYSGSRLLTSYCSNFLDMCNAAFQEYILSPANEDAILVKRSSQISPDSNSLYPHEYNDHHQYQNMAVNTNKNTNHRPNSSYSTNSNSNSDSRSNSNSNTPYSSPNDRKGKGRRSDRRRSNRSSNSYDFPTSKSNPFNFLCRAQSTYPENICVSCILNSKIELIPSLTCGTVFNQLFEIVNENKSIDDDDSNVTYNTDNEENVYINSVPPKKVADGSSNNDNDDYSSSRKESNDFHSFVLRKGTSLPATLGTLGVISLVIMGTAMFVVGRRRLQKRANKSLMPNAKDGFGGNSAYIHFPGTDDYYSYLNGTDSHIRYMDSIFTDDTNTCLNFIKARSLLLAQINTEKRNSFLHKAHLIPELPSDTIHSKTAYLCKSVLQCGIFVRQSDFAILKTYLLSLASKTSSPSLCYQTQSSCITLSLYKKQLPTTSNNGTLIKALKYKPLSGSSLRNCIYSINSTSIRNTSSVKFNSKNRGIDTYSFGEHSFGDLEETDALDVSSHSFGGSTTNVGDVLHSSLNRKQMKTKGCKSLSKDSSSIKVLDDEIGDETFMFSPAKSSYKDYSINKENNDYVGNSVEFLPETLYMNNDYNLKHNFNDIPPLLKSDVNIKHNNNDTVGTIKSAIAHLSILAKNANKNKNRKNSLSPTSASHSQPVVISMPRQSSRSIANSRSSSNGSLTDLQDDAFEREFRKVF